MPAKKKNQKTNKPKAQQQSISEQTTPSSTKNALSQEQKYKKILTNIENHQSRNQNEQQQSQQSQQQNQIQQQQQPLQQNMLCKRVPMVFPNFEPQFPEIIQHCSDQLHVHFEEVQVNLIRREKSLQILSIMCEKEIAGEDDDYEVLKVVINTLTQGDDQHKIEEMYCSCGNYFKDGCCPHLFLFFQFIDEIDMLGDYCDESDDDNNHAPRIHIGDDDSSDDFDINDNDSSSSDGVDPRLFLQSLLGFPGLPIPGIPLGIGQMLQGMHPQVINSQNNPGMPPGVQVLRLGQPQMPLSLGMMRPQLPQEPYSFREQRTRENQETENKIRTRTTIDTRFSSNPNIDKEIKCQICLDCMKHPVILPCYCHSACFNCIKQQINIQFQNSESVVRSGEGKRQAILSCPTCGRQGGTKMIFSYQNLSINTELERVIFSYEKQLEKFEKDYATVVDEKNEQKQQIKEQSKDLINLNLDTLQLRLENGTLQRKNQTLQDKLDEINKGFQNIEQIEVENNQVCLNLQKFEGIFSDLKNNKNQKNEKKSNEQNKNKKKQVIKKTQQTKLQKFIDNIINESDDNNTRNKKRKPRKNDSITQVD